MGKHNCDCRKSRQDRLIAILRGWLHEPKHAAAEQHPATVLPVYHDGWGVQR